MLRKWIVGIYNHIMTILCILRPISCFYRYFYYLIISNNISYFNTSFIIFLSILTITAYFYFILYFWREFSPIVCFFWGPSPDGPTSTHGTGCQVKQLLRIRQHWLRYIKFVFIFCDNHLSTSGNRTWDLCSMANRLQTHAMATLY